MPIVVVGASGGLPTPAPIAIVRPQDAEPFVLAAAFVEVGGLYATADPRRICVFERYAEAVLVDTVHPDDQRILTLHPVGVFAALDEQLLLVHGETSVTAVGIDGIKWESDDLFADDLHIRRTDNGRIVCRGWNYNVSSTAPVEVTLDARTGKVIA
jgi:hypothetical protein